MRTQYLSYPPKDPLFLRSWSSLMTCVRTSKYIPVVLMHQYTTTLINVSLCFKYTALSGLEKMWVLSLPSLWGLVRASKVVRILQKCWWSLKTPPRPACAWMMSRYGQDGEMDLVGQYGPIMDLGFRVYIFLNLDYNYLVSPSRYMSNLYISVIARLSIHIEAESYYIYMTTRLNPATSNFQSPPISALLPTHPTHTSIHHATNPNIKAVTIDKTKFTWLFVSTSSPLTILISSSGDSESRLDFDFDLEEGEEEEGEEEGGKASSVRMRFKVRENWVHWSVAPRRESSYYT